MHFLLYVISYVTFALVTALWGTLFSYRLDYIALTHVYLCFVVGIPSYLLVRIWLRPSETTRLPVSIIFALAWILTLYYFNLYFGRSGSLALTAMLYGGSAYLWRRQKWSFAESNTRIQRADLEKMIYLTCTASLAFMYYSVVRPAPNDFGSNGITTYFTDQLWHAGNAWTLTLSMPPISPNLMNSIVTKYHLYSQIIAADLSMMTGIPASLCSLNYVNILFASLAGLAVICFCVTLRLSTICYPLTAFFFLSFTSCVSESYFVGCSIATIVLALALSRTKITDMHLVELLAIAIGTSICTFTKGSLGAILVATMGIFVSYEGIRYHQNMRKAFMIIAGISVMWLATYILYFYNAALSGGFSWSPMRNLPGGGSIEDAIHALTRVIHAKIKNHEPKAWLLALRETEYVLLRITEVSSALVASAKFFVIAFLIPLFIKNRTAAIPLFFALIGVFCYWNMSFQGDEEWFLHSGCFALVLATAILFHFWWQKIASDSVFAKAYLFILALFCCTYQLATDRFAVSGALYALHDKFSGTSMRYGADKKEYPAITTDLLDILEYARDHTPPLAHIVHNVGIDQNLFRTFPSYAVSALSERFACVESLHFVLGERARDYVSDMNSLTDEKINSIPDELFRSHIRRAKQCHDTIRRIATSTVEAQDIHWLTDIDKDVYFLFPIARVNYFRNVVGDSITLVHENKTYGLARLTK